MYLFAVKNLLRLNHDCDNIWRVSMLSMQLPKYWQVRLSLKAPTAWLCPAFESPVPEILICFRWIINSISYIWLLIHSVFSIVALTRLKYLACGWWVHVGRPLHKHILNVLQLLKQGCLKQFEGHNVLDFFLVTCQRHVFQTTDSS